MWSRAPDDTMHRRKWGGRQKITLAAGRAWSLSCLDRSFLIGKVRCDNTTGPGLEPLCLQRPTFPRQGCLKDLKHYQEKKGCDCFSILAGTLFDWENAGMMLHHFITLWPWASSWTSLSLCFHLWIRGIKLSPLKGFWWSCPSSLLYSSLQQQGLGSDLPCDLG